MPKTFLRTLALVIACPGALLVAAEAVVIDGSSTVYPISMAVAELCNERSGGQFEISVSGTSAGMRNFTSGRIPLAAASRTIRPDEVRACETLGIRFVEVPVAMDGLTVAVNARNTFIDHLTIAELKRLWEPDSRVRTWADVRTGWPDLPVALFGPGGNSGTFDFFTEVVVGKARAIRADFTASEDDNDLVQGLVSNSNALAYFGWSYYQQNSTLLRAVPVDGGHGPVGPSREVIIDGRYAPLSRPLFYYVAVDALDRPEVAGFLTAALDATALIEDAGYVPLSPELRAVIRARIDQRVAGSLFADRAGHPRLTEVYLADGGQIAPPAPTPAAPVILPMAVAVEAAAAPSAPTVVTPAQTVARVEEPGPPSQVAAALTVEEIERLRHASLALARATLERTPDPQVLLRRIEDVREASLPIAGKTAP